MITDIYKTDKKYRLIYADPAWTFKNKCTGGSMKSGADSHYTTTSLDGMKKLPVKDITDDDCVLVMWWVGSQPQEALDLVEAWGFKLKTMTGFNWVKLTTTGKPFFGMGFWTRAGSECALIAVKGNPKPVSHSVRSVTTSYVGRHSRKPDAVRKKLHELCGDVPRIELFAREDHPDWDVWGNEL